MGGLPCAKHIINQRTIALMQAVEKVMLDPSTQDALGESEHQELIERMLAADMALVNGGDTKGGYRYVVDRLIQHGIVDSRVWQV